MKAERVNHLLSCLNRRKNAPWSLINLWTGGTLWMINNRTNKSPSELIRATGRSTIWIILWFYWIHTFDLHMYCFCNNYTSQKEPGNDPILIVSLNCTQVNHRGLGWIKCLSFHTSLGVWTIRALNTPRITYYALCIIVLININTQPAVFRASNAKQLV